jgi:hypothetical protein
MKAQHVFVLGLAAVSLILAETVNLTGTVKNQFGNAMVSATVNLLGTSLTAKTSTTGAFTLSGQATSVSRLRQAEAPAAFNMNVRNGNFEINIKKPTMAGIELFDTRGMLIGAARFTEGTTSAAIPFRGKACSAVSVRVKAGDIVSTEKYVSTSHPNFRSSIASYQPSEKSSYAKQAATSAVGQIYFKLCPGLQPTISKRGP